MKLLVMQTINQKIYRTLITRNWAALVVVAIIAVVISVTITLAGPATTMTKYMIKQMKIYLKNQFYFHYIFVGI